MTWSKVELDGNPIIDLTNDTVEPNKMIAGTTAHDRLGKNITGNIPTKDGDDLTVSGKTVTVPAGYYDDTYTKDIASAVVTASADKSTVSSNTITVTPKYTVVTGKDGYVSSGSVSGTPVTVSASELVSGTVTITNTSSTSPTDVTN